MHNKLLKHELHFNEECAKEAVAHMINEDGTNGPHWTVEETTSAANQYGINLTSGKYNKWDWYVAMNMIYSDFYKALVSITGSASTKHFVELTKAWLCDKDIAEGKMWHYYTRIMLDEEEDEVEHDEYDNHTEHEIHTAEYATHNEHIYPSKHRTTYIIYR